MQPAKNLLFSSLLFSSLLFSSLLFSSAAQAAGEDGGRG
ncbi:Opacity protein opA54, partial [Neisseria gonorrhoeae]